MAVLTNCGPKHPADWFRIAFEVLLENVHKIVFLTPSPWGRFQFHSPDSELNEALDLFDLTVSSLFMRHG